MQGKIDKNEELKSINDKLFKEVDYLVKMINKQHSSKEIQG